MGHQIEWFFPLEGPHRGIVHGNGRLGLLAWGGANELILTLGRADLWDHRGGMEWSEKQNFQAIFDALRASDMDKIREIFAPSAGIIPGYPKSPTILPVGRFRLKFPKSLTLRSAKLDVATGISTILARRRGENIEMKLAVDPERDCFMLSTPVRPDAEAVPAFDLVPALGTLSFAPPTRLEGKIQGWIQPLPADPAIGAAVRITPDGVTGAVERGEFIELPERLERRLRGKSAPRFRHVAAHWKKFWKTTPEIHLGNPRLEELYYLGLYRFGSYVDASKNIAGTLQGPWIEDQRMPLWSSDYHFNINVQMCYSPAFAAGRFAELRQLFDMVLGWRDRLRRNAKFFIGVEDGYMLPHAVDDRGTCMGGFWTGAIDHGCTAWIAKMMYDYTLYTGDFAFLRDAVFDFMRGAFNVYYAMMRRTESGALELPLSVSPEFKGAALDAWGANASFQLAAAHNLTENLLAAAERLDRVPDPRWLEVRDRLPRAEIFNDPKYPRIALWRDQDLCESHRHHSHLGGIVPFDTISVEDPAWRDIVDNSFRQWVLQGHGLWSGWCVPWAAMLLTHMDNPRLSELALTAWETVFCNRGHGSLHDSDVPGFTLFGDWKMTHARDTRRNSVEERVETMQIDGSMGAVNAIQDMLLHTRRGVLYIGAGVPERWPAASFTEMPTVFGVRVSASFERGRAQFLRLAADRDTTVPLRLPDGLRRKFRIKAGKRSRTLEFNGAVELRAGEIAEFTD